MDAILQDEAAADRRGVKDSGAAVAADKAIHTGWVDRRRLHREPSTPLMAALYHPVAAAVAPGVDSVMTAGVARGR